LHNFYTSKWRDDRAARRLRGTFLAALAIQGLEMPASYWESSSKIRTFPHLTRDAHADVVVIGGGMTGLTAAYLLKRAGKRVIVLDRSKVAGGETNYTTAHLSCVTDLRLTQLIKSFGEDHARAVWDAGLAAISQIAENVREEHISCHFAWVPAYLHLPIGGPAGDNELEDLRQDAGAASELGFDAQFVDKAPLVNMPAIEFPSQARFHPRMYLKALSDAIDGDGSAIFESTSVDTVEDDPLTVVAGNHRVTCDHVIVATHNPIVGKAGLIGATLLQTKLALYSTYAVAGRTERGRIPDALFWDTGDPYRYLRIEPDGEHDVVILGGEDHKTGQETDGERRYKTLESALERLVPGINIVDRWSGQVIETNDGLPYIGEMAPRQFAITGFSGNGITFGTVGAMMARDAVLGHRNPWAELFDIHRTRIRGGVWDYLKENKDYPYYLVRDRFAGAEGKSTRALPRNSGAILEIDGKQVAAYRHDDGELTLRSATCTHMGCRVVWNGAERTWDCPCHGSRFSAMGEVLSGPAEKPLEEFSTKEHINK